MKKDKSTEMDDKYWEGISSLNEEKDLKNGRSESYFQHLNELGKEEMRWDFTDFIEQVEHADPLVISTRKRSTLRKMLAYGAAVAAIFVVGLFFWRSTTTELEIFQGPQFSNVKLTPRSMDAKEIDTPVTPSYAVINTSKKRTIRKTIAPVPLASGTEAAPVAEEEAYVIVNGQPIYNQEEAEQIALASLKIMATNFQEGKNALEKVKYIHVEL